MYPKELKVQTQAVTEETKQNNLLFILQIGYRTSELLSNSQSSTYKLLLLPQRSVLSQNPSHAAAKQNQDPLRREKDISVIPALKS